MRLHGVFVPLLTPLDDALRLDVGALHAHVERLLEAGVDGVVALGTTGEFADLTAEERAEVVGATVRAVARRVPVVAGIGGVGTAEACAHAQRARAAGADAVLALPPLYWKLDDDGLLRHYEAITRATPLPVVLYDFPSLSGTPLSPVFVDRAARALEQVVGVKQSAGEQRLTHAVLARVKPHRPEFAVLTGAADLVLPSLLAGADGTIAAIGNVDARPLVALLAAHERGDLAAAVDEHRRVLDLLAIPALARPPLLALKVAAQVFGSPIGPAVRTPPPDAEAVAGEASRLAHELRA